MNPRQKVEQIVLLMSPVVAESIPAAEQASRLRAVARLATAAAQDLCEARRVVLTIPGDPAQLSTNKIKQMAHHPAGRHIISEKCNQWRARARLVALSERLAPFTGKARISFVVHRGRKTDPDAVSFSCLAFKGIIDGLVKSGLLKGDSDHYVETGFVEQETGARWKGREEVLVDIVEVER